MQASRWHRFLEIFALSGFAFAQPVFDIFGRTPEFFVIQRTSPIEMALMIAVWMLLLPFILLLVEELIGLLGEKLQYWFHAILLGGLASASLLQTLSKSGLEIGAGYFFTLIAVMTVIAAVYLGSRKFASLIRFFSIAPFLFAIMFAVRLGEEGLFSGSKSGFGNIEKPGVQAPTFLIIFDEFPLYTLLKSDLTINEKRFPGFSELSRIATWFRNGTAISSWTERAVPSILTGQLPDPKRKQLPSVKEYPQNIFTMLSGSHAVKGFEQVTYLCPDSICKEALARTSLSESFKTLIEDSLVVYLHLVSPKSTKKYLPDIGFQWGGFLKAEGASKVKKLGKKGLLDKGEWADDLWLFDQFIDAIRSYGSSATPNDKAPFYMIHVTFPHVPYRMLPDGKKYFLDLDKNNTRGYKKQWGKYDHYESSLAMERFILQAAYADKMIQKFIEALRESNLLESSTFAVVADHGSSFRPGEFSRRVSERNFTEILPIPYFIKPPGSLEGGISDKNITTLDVTPTLLSFNSIGSSQALDGQNVFLDTYVEKDHKIFYPLETAKEAIKFPRRLDLSPNVTRMVDLFGDGGFDDRFFNFGADLWRLYGKSSSNIPIKVDSSFAVSLDNIDQYKSVGSVPDFLPLTVIGEVAAPAAAEVELQRKLVLIEVNGVVGTVAKTEPFSGGKARFSAFLNPKLLKSGDNLVKASVISQ